MQPSYSYNMDPGFGQLSMVPQDDSKMALGHNIKEEQRTKENPIPSENLKSNQQVYKHRSHSFSIINFLMHFLFFPDFR